MRHDRLLDIDGFDVATEPDVQIASKFFRGLSDPTRRGNKRGPRSRSSGT